LGPLARETIPIANSEGSPAPAIPFARVPWRNGANPGALGR
jgi:hypothetical protein